MAKEAKEKNKNTGLIALIVCGTITIAIIIACVFFPEEIFGIFLK